MRYIASVLFKNAFGLAVEFTSDKDKINNTLIPVINYSDEKFANALTVRPHTLLFETGIKDHIIEVSNDPSFFKVFFKAGRGDVPFDFLAASFWLISRYEEYLPHKTDKFNRFHYKSSLAYQYDFLEMPLVNFWLKEIKNLLRNKFTDIDIKDRLYNYVSTIDIDNAYRYRYKGFVRTFAGFLNDLIKKDFAGIRERFKIIIGRKADPFDAYEFLIDTHNTKNINVIYFILLGDYGVNDKNHSANNFAFQELIKHLADYSTVGIHPSFGSNENLQKLKIELSRLTNITHFRITKSRQHFSILSFPQTYQNLLLAGIGDDYSMGYTNKNGFRASFCYPFNWYSLDDEQETALKVHSFCLTENTLAYYSRVENTPFIKLADPIVRVVKECGGELISVFHNDSFTDEMKENYLEFTRKAALG